MITNILKNLESSNDPLLSPTLWGLQTWGMWQPKKGLVKIVHNLIHILACLFVLSQYIELWLLRNNLEMALRNLSVTMLSTVCVVKAGTFVCWQKYWREVIEYVSNLERRQLSKGDRLTDTIIKEYTKYSRKVTYFYWSLVTATVITVMLAPLLSFMTTAQNRELIRNGSAPYPEIMSSWVPFDKTRSFGYWVTVLEHSLICVYGGGIVANYDSNAVVLMNFFAGQLKLLSANCARLFECPNSSCDDALKIKECHSHHVSLLRYSSVLSSLLSPVMFLYVIICSLMIFSSAVQLTTEGTGNMQRIWIAEYLLALIAQLFLYCWHSNEVLYMSHKADEGIYASAWWSANVRLRRSVVLLGAQLRRPILFKAGPFTFLTVATFVSILKGSYSYYTLLAKKDA